MPEQRITISLSNILLILAIALVMVLLWQLRSLVVILMVAVVMAATIAPAIDRAERLQMPRWLAVITVYLTLIAIVTGAGLLIGPTVVEQSQRLAVNTPVYLENLRIQVENFLVNLNAARPDLARRLLNTQSLTNWVIGSSQQVLLRSYGITRGIIGGVFSFILALLISGYMVAGSQELVKGLVQLFPSPWDERLAAQVAPASQRMGSYIQGRVLVSAILGVVITLGLRILGLSEFALALGVIAGFTNLIPFLGPVLGAVPALIVAISQGGLTFLWVLLLFVIIQNLETYVLDPLLVGSSVKVYPLYQLLAVLGGTQVLGIVGAVIVPPWVAGTAVLLENLYLKPKLAAEQQAQLAAAPPPPDSSTPVPNHSSRLSQG
ncbi:AI-2E family transporter [Funiculus sociatus GB2-A5]|uniref:AI-2E family transporter n=1 Tax=Funiculus sociatus GB2-A5 TaxID=2933946 RepID=A0ABV0JW10_9CYAN|nr:AI-2E family transporter [Trichocoleus sp. FACHB-832]MBD2062845.1 AI-2E family transporter [Trichocoleus sp. FACHB-6]